MNPARLPLSLLAACCLACDTEQQPEPEPEPAAPATFLLVSLDTTRADALSCYSEQNHWGLAFPPESRPVPSTPVADGLAERGLRFAWALSHAPTTLSSHASVFTGLDSHGHGVVRNGYPLEGELPLMTERFAQAGWDTLAVIGSSALERRMGLDRGFRSYDDPGPQPTGGMYIRDAETVTAAALAAVDARQQAGSEQGDLLLFVHYFDAHTPWFTAPAELVRKFATHSYQGTVDGSMKSISQLALQRVTGRLRYGDARYARALYLAQVAWADQQLGLLLQGLEERGLMEDSLVALFADHGETLEENERNPYTHGPDVDLVDIHVPLILAGRGRFGLPVQEIGSLVRLMDLGPTLLGLAGMDASLGQGRDLAPLWQGQALPSVPSFAEATKPDQQESTKAWNNLPFERAVAQDGHLLVAEPLRGGVGTLHRVAAGQPLQRDGGRARQLAGLLRAWDEAAPPHRAVDMAPATVQALRALGYLAEEPSAE